MAEKLNCWEFNSCGRDVSGGNTFELGVCPASTNIPLDGIHGGISAGRACWVVPGTMCEGKIQKNLSRKYRNCCSCDFHDYVKEEESEEFISTVELLARLGSSSARSVVLHTVCSFTLEPIKECDVTRSSAKHRCPYSLESVKECLSLQVIEAPLEIKGVRAEEIDFTDFRSYLLNKKTFPLSYMPCDLL